MLRPRVIPCLLVRDKGLVKTIGFSDAKYVGDPINAVKIFNEKEVDELIVLDIDATVLGKEPDYQMIEKIATESRMPLCYGGGVKSVEHAKKVIQLGVEKIAISSAAVKYPDFVRQISEEIGSQSVVVILDVKKRLFGKYEVLINNGKTKTGRDPKSLAPQLETLGAGEIVLNSIDNDGRMNGYDLSVAEQVATNINIPMTVLGGAGTTEDIGALIDKFGVIGAAAGSMFVFKGIYRAVLINYLSAETRDQYALRSVNPLDDVS